MPDPVEGDIVWVPNQAMILQQYVAAAEMGWFVIPKIGLEKIPPRDFQFGHTCQIDCTFRIVANEPRPEKIQAAISSYARNMERMVSLTMLPIETAFWGYVNARTACQASFNILGRPDISSHGPGAPDDPAVRDRLHAENRRLQDEFLALRLAEGDIPGKRFVDYRWLLGATMVDTIAIQNASHVGQAVYATLSAIVTGAWTAFESLSEDLWEAVINTHPETLAELSGNKGGLSAEGKSVALKFFQMHGYDLSGLMGTVLKAKQNFRTLETIRAAYLAAFPAKTRGDIEAALEDGAIDDLSAARNVIVHHSGEADDDFCKLPKKNPILAAVVLGQQLPLDGPLVRDIVSGAVKASVSLIRAVDGWLAANPTGGSDGKRVRRGDARGNPPA